MSEANEDKLNSLVNKRSQRFERGGSKGGTLGINDRSNDRWLSCEAESATEYIWLLNRGDEVRIANAAGETEENRGGRMSCENIRCRYHKKGECEHEAPLRCLHFIQADEASDSSQVAGSVSDDENQDWMLETGLWVKSKTTGRLYAPKHIPDSDIDCIIVDGVWFERSE